MNKEHEGGRVNSSSWNQMMALAFFANGIGIFGGRILTGWGLAEDYKLQYLICWYGAGLFLAALFLLRHTISLSMREVTIAGLMAAASVGGQICLLTAMELGVPGHIVFPIANGGGLFMVALAGVFLFGERIHAYGVAGIVLGIVAAVLLSLP